MKSFEEFLPEIQTAWGKLKVIIVDANRIEQNAINAFKEIVEICIPSVIGLFRDNEWEALWQKYDDRVTDILSNLDIKNNSYHFIDYALVFSTKDADVKVLSVTYELFCAFDNLVNSLLMLIQADNQTSNRFYQPLIQKIREVVKDGASIAQEDNNSSFKNYINEIAFFYYVASNTTIWLLEIEKDMPNNKKADFLLRWGETDYFVDTITIHNTSQQEDMNKYIVGKINDKFEAKTKGLNDKDIISRFRVLPIIEYNDERLLEYIPNLPVDKCLPPMIPLKMIDKEITIILETLPLIEEIKNQLI